MGNSLLKCPESSPRVFCFRRLDFFVQPILVHLYVWFWVRKQKTYPPRLLQKGAEEFKSVGLTYTVTGLPKKKRNAAGYIYTMTHDLKTARK